MDYFGVRNLEKYQHYKDRDPKWVKLYYSILDDEAFIFLSEIDRCRYMTCLILASRNHNKIPADPAYLKKVMRLDKSPDLSPLLSCGLLYAYESSSICLDKDYTNAPVPNGSLLSSSLLSSSESSEGKESEKGEKKPRALHSYPDDFQPDDRAKAIAAGYGQNVFALKAAFQDHHLAKGTLFKDWQAAFRTWLRNDRKFKEVKR